ncbi:MAG: glycosyltransferase family 2 protein [Cellulosilyticum sp.]|nr:glycosyltransferase family 2 protein [Cellulosilyticum sp.]
MSKVSIVIPNYNGMNYLKSCIESLRIQDNLEFETIIIDNASQDSDYKWVKEEYPDIIWKKLNQNYGFSSAVNEGIKMAKGEYVLLLNNDTVLEADFVSQMVKAIERDKRIFGVSSKMIAYHNHSMMDDAGDEYTVLGWAYKTGDGKPVEQFTKRKRVFSACAGAALYRKEVFDKIGLFDENFFAYMEDVDVSYRARIYGYYNVYCPDAKVYHIGSATSGSKYNEFKVRLAARNNVYVPYKNMPFIQLLINFPALVVGTWVKYLWFRKQGFGEAYREGFVEGLKNAHQIEKVTYQRKHLKNYIVIEGLLILNTVKYMISKLVK